MESNGVKYRIHVTQETADALIARGKENWLIPREDKIVAKGKGVMQTYFVDVITAKNRSVVSSALSLSQGGSQEGEDKTAMTQLASVRNVEVALSNRSLLAQTNII